jgi:hypothetical protein
MDDDEDDARQRALVHNGDGISVAFVVGEDILAALSGQFGWIMRSKRHKEIGMVDKNSLLRLGMILICVGCGQLPERVPMLCIIILLDRMYENKR